MPRVLYVCERLFERSETETLNRLLEGLGQKFKVFASSRLTEETVLILDGAAPPYSALIAHVPYEEEWDVPGPGAGSKPIRREIHAPYRKGLSVLQALKRRHDIPVIAYLPAAGPARLESPFFQLAGIDAIVPKSGDPLIDLSALTSALDDLLETYARTPKFPVPPEFFCDGFTTSVETRIRLRIGVMTTAAAWIVELGREYPDRLTLAVREGHRPVPEFDLKSGLDILASEAGEGMLVTLTAKGAGLEARRVLSKICSVLQCRYPWDLRTNLFDDLPDPVDEHTPRFGKDGLIEFLQELRRTGIHVLGCGGGVIPKPKSAIAALEIKYGLDGLHARALEIVKKSALGAKYPEGIAWVCEGILYQLGRQETLDKLLQLRADLKAGGGADRPETRIDLILAGMCARLGKPVPEGIEELSAQEISLYFDSG